MASRKVIRIEAEVEDMIEQKALIKWKGPEYVFMLRGEPVWISWLRIQGEREIMDGAWPLRRQKEIEPERRVSLSHGEDIFSTTGT